MLVLTAVALLFVSLLLYIRLGSAGVPTGRVAAMLVELWLTFAAIVGLFAMASRTLGAVPRSTVPGEWGAGWAQVRALPPGQQVLLLVLLLAAVGLLGHLFWSMNHLTRADRDAVGDGPRDRE
jgi:hypothetical protein